MEKYGIDNVRGGSYSKLILDNNEIKFITKRIDSATDKCYKCGNNGHFAKDCDTITKSSSNNTTTESSSSNTITESSSSNNFTTNTLTKFFNCKYCNKEFASLKSCTTCENLYCKNKPSNSKNQIKKPEINHIKKPEINQVNLISSNPEDIIVYCCKYYNKKFDTLKGVTGHENLYCKQKNNTTNINCYKCDREGHFSNNCYATKHINGKILS